MTQQKQQKFAKCAAKFRQCIDSQQYKGAIKHAREALKIAPQHMIVQSDLAFALLRDKQYQVAYYHYKKIFHASDQLKAQASPTWLDGLAEVCGWLNKKEELQRYGCLSLRMADQKASAVETPVYRARRAFNPQHRQRNIIAFSLFGDQPRYCEGAVLNAQAARKIYPHWCCRFYISEDVPTHVLKRLKIAGAQIVLIRADEHSVDPLMWRFQVLDDPEVDFYLLRDADALLNSKEAAAVNQWLASPFWYHHMRDYFSHTELLLAGMWGGCRGLLPSITGLMHNHTRTAVKAGRFIDQHFLKSHIWPVIRHSILNHDEIFRFHHAQPYPSFSKEDVTTTQFHIGSNYSFEAIGGVVADKKNTRQGWRIINEHEEEVCRYSTLVKNAKWQVLLPYSYISAIKSKRWRVELIAFEAVTVY